MASPISGNSFAARIIRWQKREGRHHLPWQLTRNPYHIWLSEIMLQQTQVATVIPYYERFTTTFPTLVDLANAPLDEVMRLWSGLGYYARARNLHAAARQIVDEHHGIFPRDVADIHALPGIGRSTAAAISVFSYGDRNAILDGNVKRVMARYFGIEGDVKSKSVEENLWEIAERELPAGSTEAYTQGLMDLGSLVCTRNTPACLLCPLKDNCVAFNEGRIADFPGKGKKKSTVYREVQMLLLLAGHEVLLEKRPPNGIWGGLWSLPEVPMELNAKDEAKRRFGIAGRLGEEQDPLTHAFTHFTLTIYPRLITVAKRKETGLLKDASAVWLNLDEAVNAALPAPVKKILRDLGTD